MLSAQASSTSARTCTQRRRQRGRPSGKLHHDGILFALMHHHLGQRWSHYQIALTLARTLAKGHEHRVSHETNYNCIYAQPMGELKREQSANHTATIALYDLAGLYSWTVLDYVNNAISKLLKGDAIKLHCVALRCAAF